MMISNNKFQFRNVTTRNQPLCHDTERCYCQDTIQHLKENEKRFTYPAIKMVYSNNDEHNEEYFKRCSLNTFRQRTIEWMILIQEYFTNCEETLEMSVCLFDFVFYNDFYAKVKASEYDKENANGFDYEKKKKHYYHQEQLQLAALTCYFLSCKFWERFPPKASKLIHLTEYSYTENQLLSMEREILMRLDFDLKIPLISQYIEFYMLHEKVFYLSKITTLSHYLTNLTLTEMIFANRLSSSLAAVILTLSKMILIVFSTNDENGNEPSLLNSCVNYDEHLFGVEDFYEILKDTWQIFIKSLTGNSFKMQKKKFSEQKYSYLYLYLESIDVQRLQLHYQDLNCRVKNYVNAKYE